MRRGWRVPYLGRWFAVPEATRELAPGGPIAVLHLEPGTDDDDRVVVRELAFWSVHRRELDARTLPPALVSEAALDVLGAVRAGSASDGGPDPDRRFARDADRRRPGRAPDTDPRSPAAPGRRPRPGHGVQRKQLRDQEETEQPDASA